MPTPDPAPSQPPLFFLIAGEASGDLLGARLMQALKKQTDGQVRFAGIGGPRMQAEGIDLLFLQEELAHFGLFELLRHIPHLLRRMRETKAVIRRLRPAALITIDAPDFCFRVARSLKGAGIPLIHYVAPTVWVWRAGRAKKIAKFLDHLLALLPFEPPYFTHEGLPCDFVGHPIVESGADQGDAARFRTKFSIPATATLVSLLPGSRMSEVSRLLPVFGETVALLARHYPDLRLLLPTVPALRDYIAAQVEHWAAPVTLIDNDSDKYDGFAASSAALACSGTVTIELAMALLPAVIAYKVSALTLFLYRRFLKIDYASLVNIMHNRMVMPELLQGDCTPEKLAAALTALIDDVAVRQKQLDGLGSVAGWLGQGQFIPSERAATIVRNVVKAETDKK
jgi:lipid-A-disaccharide synthase